MAGSLFIFRRKLPDKEAPVPHAVLSLASRRVFAFVTGVAGDTLRNTPKESGIGVGLIALEFPDFIYFAG